MPGEWYVHILECADGTFYTGMSSDPVARLAQHNAGLDPAGYTFPRRPVRLVWAEGFPQRQAAIAREHQVKGWSHAKKAALVRHDWEGIHAIVRTERRRGERSPK